MLGLQFFRDVVELRPAWKCVASFVFAPSHQLHQP